MTSTPIIFDIETGPLPLEQIKRILPPFDRTTLGAEPKPFDPSAVKLGNTKDEKLIADKIAAAKAKHESDSVSWWQSAEKAEPDYWAAIEERAALSSITGQVLAIGYSGQAQQIHTVGDGVQESALLAHFWGIYKKARAAHRKLIGFNSKGFDIPFLVQRSYILGVDVPAMILTPTGYLEATFVDLADIWKAGNRGWGEKGFGSLDTIAKALGVGSKLPGVTGADFARLFNSTDPAERQLALDYLSADLAITRAVAERFGVA